jgi:hypothetical protein
MRINELIVESQQIDEISLAGIGKGIGKAANMAGKAVGGAVGGTVAAAKQFGSGVKQGYQGASSAVGSDQSAAPAATSAPANTNTSGDINGILQTIDKLDKPSKQQLAGELEKSIASTPDPKSAPAVTPPAVTPPAGGTAPAVDPVAGKTPEEAMKDPRYKTDPAFKAEVDKAASIGTAPTTPAPTTPPAGGKMTQAQQDALKAKLQGQRQAGKTVASQTGSGFNQYVQGGGGSTLAGADAQGNPVFKQNVKREDVQFESKFLGMML